MESEIAECSIANIEYIFSPRSIAIIGASHNKIGGSKYYLANKTSGYVENGGKIYLINPKLETLFGEVVYPSLQDERIPKPVDLVIIAVPARHVPQIILECHNQALFGVIYSSGFGEAGNLELESQLVHAVSQVNTRFIGPNGLGILNPYHNLTIYPDWEHFTGGISYIAQSGGTMARLYLMLGSIGIGFRKVVSIGNAIDIKITDLLRCFASDPKTNTIALYLESVPNGREFFELARKITEYKPIILWKGGQTPRGINATLSHTGGLAGKFKIWEAMCKQAGIILADHFELFMDLNQIMAIRPVLPKSLDVAVYVAGGGIGVEFTDVCEKEGINIVDLSPSTIEKLSQIFPRVNTNFNNPIDTGEMGYDPSLFAKGFEAVLQDPNVDSVIFVREPERFEIISGLLGIPDAQKATVDYIQDLTAKYQKPVFCNLSKNEEGETSYQVQYAFKKELIQIGVPVIDIITNIPKIIKELHKFWKKGKKIKN
jgi:acyl-CoA synthetase (NDP forming)